METQRQKKINQLIQKDLGSILDKTFRDNGVKNLLVSITKVKVASDLSIAKVYLSIFPSEKSELVIMEINEYKSKIKHQLSTLMRNQLRKLPELVYYIDDTLDYIENIDNVLKNPENPIKDISYLRKRKK